MNKEQDIDNQLYKYLSPDLYCYVHNCIIDLKRQIDQLTNNWNELEEWIIDYRTNIDNPDIYEEGIIDCLDEVLDKMKEIKESKNVSDRD